MEGREDRKGKGGKGGSGEWRVFAELLAVQTR